MNITALLDHSAFLVRTIFKSSQPPDAIASDYFRKKKYIGSKERRFISECVFDCLRNTTLYLYSAARAASHAGVNIDFNTGRKLGESAAWALCSVSVLIAGKYNHKCGSWNPVALLKRIMKIESDEFLHIYGESAAKKLDFDANHADQYIGEILRAFDEISVRADQSDIEAIAARFSMPEWIINDLADNDYISLQTDSIARLAGSFNSGAPLGLRVNQMLESRDNVIAELRKSGVDATAGMLSPDAVIINERVRLLDSPLYRKGAIEVQDEGSQIISYTCRPQPGMKILDACAGAGGKTLHIADIAKDRAEILANDIEPRRLKEVSKRARRAGINNIATAIIQSRRKKIDPARFYENFDLVLVDAPCSGMGTLRRNPMKKWTLTPKLLKRLQLRQKDILAYYSRFVKPGGALIYATCSIMPEENEGVAESFLMDNTDFAADPIAPSLAQYGIDIPELSSRGNTLRLQPDLHSTDGFFVARMVKNLNI